MSTTAWWIVGYVIGGAVVLIAATLLIVINLLARRIVTQTAEITLALDGAMRNTNPLFDIGMVNHGFESITRGLKNSSGEEGDEGGRRVLQRLVSVLGRR